MISKKTLAEIRRESKRELRSQARRLYPIRVQRGLTPSQFERALQGLLEERAPDLFFDPLLGIQTVMETAITIVEFARFVERQTFKFRGGRIVLQFPRGLQPVARARNESFLGLYSPLVDIAKFRAEESEDRGGGLGKLRGSEVKKLLLQYAFLRLFTGVEVYLQDTLARSLRTGEVWTRFSENVKDEDVPTHWEDGKRISKFDYARRWQDVTTLLLRFPYHDFEGKVSHRYAAAFGFDLKRFEQLDRLVHFREMRNTLVHRGSSVVGIPLVEVRERDVVGLARTAMRLVEYVETRIPQPRTQHA